jgi:hypothetical protein
VVVDPVDEIVVVGGVVDVGLVIVVGGGVDVGCSVVDGVAIVVSSLVVSFYTYLAHMFYSNQYYSNIQIAITFAILNIYWTKM